MKNGFLRDKGENHTKGKVRRSVGKMGSGLSCAATTLLYSNVTSKVHSLLSFQQVMHLIC